MEYCNWYFRMRHKASFVQLHNSLAYLKWLLESLKKQFAEIWNYFFPTIDNIKFLKIALALEHKAY